MEEPRVKEDCAFQIYLRAHPLQAALNNFQDTNPKWKLMSALMNRETKKYPCCVEDHQIFFALNSFGCMY
ncbi:UNVERIFIED_CONTAM: hypothetical protein NCL1_40106 [Trichonephila clavipes]